MVFRYFSINWDVAVVECDWKDAILEQKAHFLISCAFSGARDAAPCFVYLYLPLIRFPIACRSAR